jgi:6-phosphogluconate dehydrogenase
MNKAEQADIGVIGLAVMGQNLILNMNDHGFITAAYNRTVSKVHDFIKGPAKNTKIIGCESLEEFVAALKKPKKAMLMVKAGSPVDDFIEVLLPLLSAGDVIIDGGNSHFQDTTRRFNHLAEKGIEFVGCGISGGEEGARHGPSIMPGGSLESFSLLAPIFTAIAARAPKLNIPCCSYVGDAGAGHFVKMVHNGIEYGDMQLIAEAYHLLKLVVGLSSLEISQVFAKWNKEELDSFLIEITSHIFKINDEKDGSPIVEKIRDCAGQKGTGKWTVNSALDLGIPTTLITEAVFARGLSSMKDERLLISKSFPLQKISALQGEEKQKFIEDIKLVVQFL